MRELTEREKWMRAHIGKIVFRPETGCSCGVCKSIYETGLMVVDELHADYLCEMEGMYISEGRPMQYFETREEALEFERNNPPINKNNQQ